MCHDAYYLWKGQRKGQIIHKDDLKNTGLEFGGLRWVPIPIWLCVFPGLTSQCASERE